MPDTTWPIDGLPPGSSQGRIDTPVSMPFPTSRHVISGSLAFVFLIPTWRLLHRLFLNAHHDSLRLTQLEVVWHLSPQSDAGGPQILHLLHSNTSRSRFPTYNDSFPRAWRNNAA